MFARLQEVANSNSNITKQNCKVSQKRFYFIRNGTFKHM